MLKNEFDPLGRLSSQHAVFSFLRRPLLSPTSEKILTETMRRLSIFSLACLLILGSAESLKAWPVDIYPEIFAKAINVLPSTLQQLMTDMESILDQPCGTDGIEEAARRAIEEFRSPAGNLRRAIGAMRDAGCAVAAVNDPAMDPLVRTEGAKFAVVFYGWHPVIQQGDLARYLQVRDEERQSLTNRFARTSQLPNLSDTIELSPEFGIAALAFSHAVTDVANVWMHIWTSVNGVIE